MVETGVGAVLRVNFTCVIDCKTSSLSIPCFAERRYGGVLEDELLIALPPKISAEIDLGSGTTISQRPSLSHSAIWHPE